MPLRALPPPPPGFDARELTRGALVAPPAEIPGLLEAGLENPAPRLGPRPAGPGSGRGPRALIEAGGELLLVKQYLRGGLLARVNRALYLDPARFLRELEVGARARAAGLPIGEVFALWLLPAGAGWLAYGAARFVDQGVDLARLLADPDCGPARAREALRASARLVAEMARVGLFHPDLNLGNVVLAPREGALVAHLVDLDRARLAGRPLSATEREALRRRFERSWRKVFREGPVPADERRAIWNEAGA